MPWKRAHALEIQGRQPSSTLVGQDKITLLGDAVLMLFYQYIALKNIACDMQ